MGLSADCISLAQCSCVEVTRFVTSICGTVKHDNTTVHANVCRKQLPLLVLQRQQSCRDSTLKVCAQLPTTLKYITFSAGLQGLTGTTDLAVQSSGTTANTTADSNITSGDASLQGRPAAHTPIKGVTGAIANATDAVVSLSQAAAAELGTEEGTANTTNTLQHSGSVWPAYTQATGSANLTGTNSSTDAVAAAAAALANPTGSASKAASLADERAAEAAQDKAEQRMSQQASSLTQPKGTAANAQKPNKQPHTLEDEVDAEFLVMQNRRDASAGTAGIGAASAKTARYADGQLTTHGMSPSELAELNEEHDNFVDPTWSRAQAQHKTALGGSTAGSHTSGRGAFPADTHRTQTGQLLGNEDDADDFNPQAALTNFQSGQ